MRRLAFIVVFLVGTMGAFAWLSQSFTTSWEPRLRTYLEETAGRLTKTQVHIDSISPAFFHRVRLLNIRIAEPDDPTHPIFQAAQIELTLSLIDLPRALYQRKPYEAIGLISVDNPWIRLSRETLGRHTSARATGSSLPPWFTLVWNGGTFQWIDSRALHGSWTFYQTKGIYRIRGPQTSVMVRGIVKEARQFRFQLTSLGHRWNAQMAVNDGQSQEVLALLRTLTQRSLLPAGWGVRGGFQLEARASGRRWPVRSDDWTRFLDRVTLTLLPQPAQEKTPVSSIGLSGTLVYKNEKITGTHLAFDSPWFAGTGQGAILLEGAPGQRNATLEATMATGMIERWPFQDARLQIRYHDGRWEFLQNTLRLLDGRVSAKGYASASDTDLAITAQNISLAALGKLHGIYFPQGSLNASCALKGPLKDWQLAGAWWLSGVQWGQASLGDARGDFDVTAQHFQAEAKSDRSHFHVALAGSSSDEALELEQLDITLPSGASFSGEGRISHPQNKLRGNFEASHIIVPSDLPFLPLGHYGMSGTLDAQGQWSGTLEHPVLNAAIQSKDLAVNHQPLGDSAVSVLWNKSNLEIPAWHVGPGITGRYAKGQGSLKIRNAQVGKWSIAQGAAHFNVSSKHLEIPDFAIQTKDMALKGQGKAQWENLTPSGVRISLEGKGELHTVRPTEAWDVPIEVHGVFITGNTAREGKLQFSARMLGGLLRGDYALVGANSEHPEGRLTARLENARWRAFPFSTDVQGVWSAEGLKPLTLKGQIKSGGEFSFSGFLSADAQANGTLKLDGFNLRPLGESLHFPKPLEGIANATLTLSGPLAQLRWNGHLEGSPVVYAAVSDHPLKMEQLSMDMTLAPLENDPSIMHLTVNEGQAKTAEELIRFTPGSYIEFAGDKPARLALGTQIRNLHFGIFTLFGGLDLDGTWQIKPQGFSIQTKAQTHSLFINDYELEEGLLLADYYNGVLQFPTPPNAPRLVTGTIDFRNIPQLQFTDLFISGKDQQGLQFTGNIGPTLWDFKMAGRGLDMGTLGELSGFPYPISGAADVQVHGTGDPSHPHVEGKVDLDRGAVLGLAYRSGSAAFVWQDARITFTKLVLSDPGHYTLEGAGVFPLRKKADLLRPTSDVHRPPSDVSRSIDFSLRLRDSNLSLLQSFSREVKNAKGPVEGLIQIKGTLDDPLLHGSLRVTNGEISGAHYFRQLRNANLALDFEGDTVTIKDLRGKSGEGEFRGSGTIVLSGFVPSQYDVKLEVVSPKGVEVQVPELAIPESPLAKRFKFLTTASRVDVRGQVSLRGPAESPTFSGEGIFSNGHFTFPPSHKHPPPAAILEWFRRIYWDVNLKFLDGAWFENELVQANVTGQLALKGPSDKLQVNGGLDISEGKISYLGLQFDIQQAHYDVRSEVSGDTVINTPFVRGVAESQIQAVDTVSGVAGASGGSRLSVNDTITLNIDYAPVDQIKPRLTSAANPTMSQDKLLARVTQTDVENLTPQERNYLYQKQLVSLIDTSLTTPLAQNVLKKTGLADRLRVQHIFDPNAVTGQDLNTPTANQQQSAAVNIFANTKYTIEKDLSNRLSLGYGVRFVPSASVDPELQQQKLDLISDVQLSYRWFRNVYLRGDFDLPTSNPNVLPERKVTIEPRWRFGWWGNTNKDKTPRKSE